MGAGRLELAGGIDLFSDSGYELHTASASLDMNRSIAWGEHPVTGHGPFGSLSADRFRADRENNQLLLTGHVHMAFIGAKKK
jgi:lipopolysaccharide export system protein LptC